MEKVENMNHKIRECLPKVVEMEQRHKETFEHTHVVAEFRRSQQITLLKVRSITWRA